MDIFAYANPTEYLKYDQQSTPDSDTPTITDELALWLQLRAPEDPYPASATNEQLRWRLGRRSLAKELLDIHRQQKSDARSEAITDIYTEIRLKQNKTTV